MSPKADKLRIKVDDLSLKVRADCDRSKWNEDKYEEFIDILCGDREYQKEAIREAMRYLRGGEYNNLRSLAKENWENNPFLEDRFGTWTNFEKNLQLPDKLSASLDLATGTGKSYIIFGIAVILLAEGSVDRVLVLCPSTTIELGLFEKFKNLAGNAELIDALPENAYYRVPKIIHADVTINPGCICVENRDAVYAHVKSSIEDSLWGKGAKVAVLNDEAHHIANDPAAKAKKWKEFLEDPKYGFNIVLGFSGTCYVENNYFSDVIYRYSLRKAIEQRYVKKVKYLADIERTGEENEDWQLRVSMHEQKRKDLKPKKIIPLSIIVTPTINKCKEVGEELIEYLKDNQNYSESDAEEKVLIVYNNSPDVAKLPMLDDFDNKVEWIVSVSMLNEGWDVKRVFQIVPHEERAFNSKLLVAQVLGRGLRVPVDWKGEQPEVVIFNHASWAGSIRHLVDEILENEKQLTGKVIDDSEYHFNLHNLKYNVKKRSEEKVKKGQFDLLSKGKVDLPMEADTIKINAQFEQALTGKTESWGSEIRRKTYKPEEVATQMHNVLVKYDMETSSMGVKEEETHYAIDYPYEKLLEIVNNSLHGLGYCTESNKQKFLQALGTLRRKKTQVVRYELDPDQMYEISTKNKPFENGSASQLRRDKVAFIPQGADKYVSEEQVEFFNEVIEEGGDYKCVHIKNKYDLKSPVSLVFGDSVNEKKFIQELLKPDNYTKFEIWIKSTSMNFYAIDYAWKKGTTPKRGKFNPDFFIKAGRLVLVIEIKDDEEIKNPSRENIKKYEYAQAHFARINDELKKVSIDTLYIFHFLTPKDYPDFFTALRADKIETYRSKLDVKLAEEAEEEAY